MISGSREPYHEENEKFRQKLFYKKSGWPYFPVDLSHLVYSYLSDFPKTDMKVCVQKYKKQPAILAQELLVGFCDKESNVALAFEVLEEKEKEALLTSPDFPLTNANLNGVEFPHSISGMNLSGTQLRKAQVGSVAGWNLRNADLTEIVCVYNGLCNFSEVTKADLLGAKLKSSSKKGILRTFFAYIYPSPLKMRDLLH